MACLEEDKTFAILALAPGAALQGVSWCRDWRIVNDGLGSNPIEYFSMYDLPQTRDYCTTGDSVPYIEAELNTRVLKVRGFDLGVVGKRGEYTVNLGNRPVRNWSNLLLNWERTAGGPWSLSSDQGLALSKSFNRTIVADKWLEGIADWKTETKALDSNLIPEDGSYVMAVSRAGINRRFFVTKTGNFGLGPWSLAVGDVLVAVLGSVVPLVLRREDKIERRCPMNQLKTYLRPMKVVFHLREKRRT